jgi:PiT family inorganic phosphate transporter
MLEILFFLFAVVLAFAVAFAAGTNDEMMAPGVAAGVFSLRTAVILGAIFSVFGAFLLGAPVAETIGSDLIGARVLTDSMIMAVLITMVLILISLSVAEGLPLSTTQAVVGAIIGVAYTAGFTSENWGFFAIDYNALFFIFAGWILSPVIGFFAAATVQFWFQRFEEIYFARFTEALEEEVTPRFRVSRREELNRAYTALLAIFLILSTASRAGNDVANSIAPVLSLSIFQGSVNNTSNILMVIGGFGMALGLIAVGWKVIKVVAREIVSMNTGSALSAMIAVTLVMTIGTISGFPLSGTHVLIAAMIAVGWADRLPIQKQIVKTIVISWIVTVPVGVVLGGVTWVIVDWFYVLLNLGA